MRVTIVLFCAAVVACAQRDQRPVAAKATSVPTVADTFTPVANPEPVKPWAPDPLPAPGDTTPQGSPTEAALLRWVHLIAPDSFPELPKSVQLSLNSRHCQ